MPEDCLNGADVVAIFEEMCGARMAQRVTAGRLGQADVARGLFDSSLEHRFMQVMSPAAFFARPVILSRMLMGIRVPRGERD